MFVLLDCVQARWRGAVVRKLMKGVRDDYLRIFEDTEESPSCRLDWRSLPVSKPHYVSLDKQPKSRQDGCQNEDDLKKETPVSVDSIVGHSSSQPYVENSLETDCPVIDSRDCENGVSRDIAIYTPEVGEHQNMFPGGQLDENVSSGERLTPSGGDNSATGSVNPDNDNFGKHLQVILLYQVSV